MDFDRREVQYRSSTRIGQHDWDVERYVTNIRRFCSLHCLFRLRYNQFVRMLEAKGGWEVHCPFALLLSLFLNNLLMIRCVLWIACIT